jgi:16S rRNA pseudouridine516 synthase
MSPRRLDQLLSSLGYCSRKEAQALCDDERVVSAGDIVNKASLRVEADTVMVDGEPLEFPNGLFVLLHKPKGYVCSHDDRDGHIIYELFPERWTLRDPAVNTVGRLDKDTSGALLLTDSGALLQRLTSPKHHVDKVYQVGLDGDVSQAMVEQFAAGMTVKDGDADELCQPCTLRAVGACQAEVVLREGKYHQIKRMFAAVGLHVETLHRSRFGPYSVDDLAEGEWRALEFP